MNKTLISTIMLLIMTSTALASVDWISTTPTNGTTIPGSTNELFDITINETIMSSFLYLNGAGPYAMNLDGTKANTTKDTSVLTELFWYPFYFITNGYVSPTYTFFLDKIPAAPTWDTPASTATENSVTLNWNNNTETDITIYTVYRNDTLLDTIVLSTYTDNTVLVGETWKYEISANDTIQESSKSTPQTILIQDVTPPNQPTFSPVTETTFTTLTPEINITYDESVSLIVRSGSYSEDLGTNNFFQYNKVFPGDGTYYFNFTACDPLNNCREDLYEINIETYNADLNLTVGSLDTWDIELFSVKNHISTFDLPDYAVYGINFSTTNNDKKFLNIRSTDLVGSTTTLEVNETIPAIAYCKIDSDAGTYDIIPAPTYNVINVNGSYNAIPRLNCPDMDGNPLNGWQYEAYVKYTFNDPVPSEDYSWGIYATRYDTVI